MVGRRTRSTLALTLVTTVALLGLVPVPTPPAVAADLPQGQHGVTMVARVCDSYSDVSANKARNNIQESLADLGPDTAYFGPNAAAAVSPDIEESIASQAACRPLPGWNFQLGTDITGKTEATDWLSTVLNPYGTNITTQASTTLYDPYGRDTGQTIAGATTVTLTQAQLDQARQRTLWVQGGTRDAPLANPPDDGFAALRCAQDGVNGDNVEYISYPQAQRHVFCYYYLVRPGATASTITVRKVVDDEADRGGRFRFDGNLSYEDTNADGINDFVLEAQSGQPASQTFIRAAGEAWSFDEVVEDGWQTPSTTCTGSDDIVLRDGGATITPGPGDTVVCTVTNTPEPPELGTLWKQTINGDSAFAFHAELPDGRTIDSDPIEVSRDDGFQMVHQMEAPYPLGEWRILETLPEADGGVWQLERVVCNGVEQTVATETVDGEQRAGAEFVLEEGEEVTDPNCYFTNRFVPTGEITISKESLDGTGNFGYQITQIQPPGTARLVGDVYEYHADTSEANPRNAIPMDGSDAADALEVGTAAQPARYRIQEILPPAADPAEYWRLESVECDGVVESIDEETAAVVVRLTEASTTAHCDFTNRLARHGTLQVVKRTTDDQALRPGVADIGYTCSDGVTHHLEVPSGETEETTPQLIAHAPEEECTIEELGTGAADGVDVSTSATVAVVGPDGTTTEDLTLPGTIQVTDETAVTVTIENAFASPPGPSPTPSPEPTPEQPPDPDPGPDDTDDGPHGALPDAGVPAGLSGLIALAILLIALGGYLVYRRRTD